MKLSQSIIASALALLSVGANAAPNLLLNGSFESGLEGWSTTTNAARDPVRLLTYATSSANASYAESAYGEQVFADNSASLSSDAAGAKGVYFVADHASETLSRTFNVTTAGIYSVGFSTYAPANGLKNAGSASFAATIDTNSIFTTQIGKPSQTWQAQAGTLNLAAGEHTVQFSFNSAKGAAKDIVIDRVYVAAVPEPETYAMLLAGLGLMGVIARRRKEQQS